MRSVPKSRPVIKVLECEDRTPGHVTRTRYQDTLPESAGVGTAALASKCSRKPAVGASGHSCVQVDTETASAGAEVWVRDSGRRLAHWGARGDS